MDGGRTRAQGVRVRTTDGAESFLPADVVVVAGGAVESTRLLLASSEGAAELGNRSGWLGRGFLDHLSVRIAPFRPRDPQAFAEMFSPVFVRDVQFTPRMVLRPQLLEREQLLSSYGHWEVATAPGSGLHVVREKLRALQSGHGLQLSSADLGALVSGARDVLALARGLAIDRRRYFPRDASVYLRVDTEQRPDAESRIALSGERDALGLPRVTVDWRISDLERRTVRRAGELLAEELERRGIGTVEQAPDPFVDEIPWGELKGDAFHMMGGTRMSRTPGDGVVDTDSRVFDTTNVYVAGASTFPTGGMANPTLTILALTLRLADHLTSTH
jgi:choline dehydrogenase-like flavoprotein